MPCLASQTRLGVRPEGPSHGPPLDSAVGDVIDDAEAWAVVLPLVQQYASRFRGADGTEQMPLRRALMFHPNSREMLTAIEDALARVSASRQERVRV